MWPGDGKDQNAHVYSGYNMITKKGKGKTVSATLVSTSGVMVTVEDIKESSKVTNAVSNAVLSMLTKNNPDDAMAYFFLKRAGDWCQALTLLDKSRKYKITAGKGSTPPFSQETTLAEIEARNASIVLITNDRVLLAYSVTLGLNVMFTNVRNQTNWLVYFKNLESGKIDDAKDVFDLSVANKLKVDAFIPFLTTLIQSLQLVISKNIDVLASVDTGQFTTAIVSIRDAAFKLARVPGIVDMVSIQTILSTAPADITNAPDPRVLASVLSRLRSANNNLASAISITNTLNSTSQPIYPDYVNEKASLDTLIAKILSKEVITSTSDVYVQYQTIIDKLFSDRSKTPLIVMSDLPDDITVRSRAAAKGITLGETRASRTSSGFSSIGFLYNYFNRSPGSQKGGGVMSGGGGPIQSHIETSYLAEPLRNAKNVLQYSTDTTDSAYKFDKTEFIAKDGNFIVDIFGNHITVVDGFITKDINLELAKRLLRDTEISQIPSDPDSIYPFLYILFKTIFNQLDEFYDELLGLKSLEYSNLDALIHFSQLRNDIAVLDKVVSEFYSKADANQRLTLQAIGDCLEPYNKWLEADLIQDNPDEMIQNYYSRIQYKDSRDIHTNLVLIEAEYVRENSTEDHTIFIEETGPQLLYMMDVDKEIGKVLTNRDVLIDMFSFKIIGGSGQTLLAYSKSIQDPAYLLQITGDKTPAAEIEEAIGAAANPPSPPQTAGLRTRRRPLYSNVPPSIIAQRSSRVPKRVKTRRDRRPKRKSKTQRSPA